jgi:hypothetical protein
MGKTGFRSRYNVFAFLLFSFLICCEGYIPRPLASPAKQVLGLLIVPAVPLVIPGSVDYYFIRSQVSLRMREFVDSDLQFRDRYFEHQPDRCDARIVELKQEKYRVSAETGNRNNTI